MDMLNRGMQNQGYRTYSTDMLNRGMQDPNGDMNRSMGKNNSGFMNNIFAGLNNSGIFGNSRYRDEFEVDPEYELLMQQRVGDQRRINKSMREAKAAIAAISKKDMAEMKVINAPSEAIQTVMGAICLLFDKKFLDPKQQKKGYDWKDAKKLLQGDLISSINKFSVDSITKKKLKLLKKDYTQHESKKQYFNKDQMAKKSLAAAGLSQWILAVQTVAETMEKLKSTEKTLNLSVINPQAETESSDQYAIDIKSTDIALPDQPKEKPSKFTQYPDKYGIKYSDTPNLGKYDIEKADKIVKSKIIDVKIKEPLNLYKKEKSVRPEGYDNVSKPFGADVKGKIDMGFKYKNDHKKGGVTPRDLDYDKMMEVTKQRIPAASFGYNRKVKREDLGSSYCSIPDKNQLAAMTREEKIELINKINARELQENSAYQ